MGLFVPALLLTFRELAVTVASYLYPPDEVFPPFSGFGVGFGVGVGVGVGVGEGFM